MASFILFRNGIERRHSLSDNELINYWIRVARIKLTQVQFLPTSLTIRAALVGVVFSMLANRLFIACWTELACERSEVKLSKPE